MSTSEFVIDAGDYSQNRLTAFDKKRKATEMKSEEVAVEMPTKRRKMNQDSEYPYFIDRGLFLIVILHF